MLRRNFIGSLSSLPFVNFLTKIKANENDLKKANKSCVLIWMGGGPPTIDMWDLKPNTEYSGKFSPIKTSIPEVEICELLPKIASSFENYSIIRSMNTREADHMRGSYYLHTGFVPNPSVIHPSAGSVLSFESKVRDLDIPPFVSINPTAFKAGYLGVKYDPFVVLDNGEIPNIDKNLVNENRIKFLNEVEENFISSKRGIMPKNHKEIYSNAIKLISSDQKNVFNIDQPSYKFNLKKEDEITKQSYGNTSLGRSLLITRRLIQAGVPFIEVNYGGWDLHSDIFNSLERKLPEFDQSLTTFVEDLKNLGMLENVTIVCMGEFGRTPRINQDIGRDHWASSWSALVAGGKFKNGKAIGKTSKDGLQIESESYNPGHIWTSVAKSMGINEDVVHTSKNGRPMKIFNGEGFIKDLF